MEIIIGSDKDVSNGYAPCAIKKDTPNFQLITKRPPWTHTITMLSPKDPLPSIKGIFKPKHTFPNFD